MQLNQSFLNLLYECQEETIKAIAYEGLLRRIIF